MHYLLSRLFSLLITLVISSIVIFTLVEIVPGDAAQMMMGIEGSPEALAALRAELGLDKSPPQRYFSWVWGMLHGDFGVSAAYRVDVGTLILERLFVSGPLALFALLLAILIGLPAGFLAASRHKSPIDYGIIGATQLGIAVPNFWFAMMLVYVFAITLKLFSSGGFVGWDAGFIAAGKSLLLPAIALALPQAAILARIARASLIEILGEDYIRTARAKGRTRRGAIFFHALRNALIPVLTILGLQFSFLLAGAIIIENVFYLPGLGRLIFQAVGGRDLVIVESCVMLLVFAVIIVNFLVEGAYLIVDPRLRRRAI